MSDDLNPGISTLDRYKQAFRVWHFASEMRFKILAYWWAVYVGLAIVFAWIWQTEPFSEVAFMVPLLGFFATFFFYWMDRRNGGAIYGSRKIISLIEAADKVPIEQRIVTATDYGPRQATAILIFALLMGTLLASATIYLLPNVRVRPNQLLGYLNSVGLLFDIVGVILIWRFGLPDVIQRTSQGHFFAEPPPASELAKAARYDFYSNLGLSLVLIGFALQLAGNFI